MRPPSSLHPVPGWGGGPRPLQAPLPSSLRVLVGGCQMTSAVGLGQLPWRQGQAPARDPLLPCSHPFAWVIYNFCLPQSTMALQLSWAGPKD